MVLRIVNITGVPGAGKSTSIDVFGLHVLKQGGKLAVLAIDPSSERTQGSILGDREPAIGDWEDHGREAEAVGPMYDSPYGTGDREARRLAYLQKSIVPDRQKYAR